MTDRLDQNVTKYHRLFLSADGILSEVLKNLVLAGVGKVILVDRGELISAHDLETNFLLADAAVGATKIPACRDFLQVTECINVFS